MRRDAGALPDTGFDLLVIGGGVLGACVARDAALRGLRVALIEAGDFGGDTSANSLKIVHGGLRYLQQFDLRRMRESIAERATWLRVAPHLVEPLPVLAPAWRSGRHRRTLLKAAVAISDLVGFDRNRGLPQDRHVPAGRAVSRSECLDLVPELDSPGLTGGVIFHDAQMYSAERLTLAVVRGAIEAGAVAVNHVRCTAPALRDGRLIGVHAADLESGERFVVSATHIVNAAGASSDSVAATLLGRPMPRPTAWSIAVNVQLPWQGHRVAFSLPGRSGRQLFVTPWRGTTLIGTGHYPLPATDSVADAVEQATMHFLDEVNRSWPGRHFGRDDVSLVHSGLLPVSAGPGVRLLRRHRIVDHAAHGEPALITATSVKYTTARKAAEEVVARIYRKRGERAPPCRTATTLLPGSPRESLSSLRERAEIEAAGRVDGEALDHLIRSYGTDASVVLTQHRDLEDWATRVDPALPVIGAQIAHAVRHEMACSVEDVLLRRTEVGPRGQAHGPARRAAARLINQAAGAAVASDRRHSGPDRPAGSAW